MPSLTLDIRPKSELSKRILAACRDRVNFSREKYRDRHDKWRAAENAALAYMPEKTVDASRRLKREQEGIPQYTTITLPYTYGVLMASHTYWTTVFMSRAPILQFSGRHGEGEQQVQAVDAVIDYQVQVGGMLVPLYIWLLDPGKYGVGVLGTYWDEEVNTVAEIVEVDQKIAGVIPTGKTKKQKITRKIRGYEGNKLHNVRPFDWFPDPRVPMYRFQDGEFCGTYFELGWHDVLARRDAGFYTNIDELEKRGGLGVGAREESGSNLEMPSEENPIFEMFGSERKEKKGNQVTKGYEVHFKLIPATWGLGKGTSTEKWVFTVTQDFELVLGAQPSGAYHNAFPFHLLQLEPEGYALTSRSLTDILDPIQRTLDWLINSHFYNVRKTLNNQFIVDPSLVVMKDILDPMAGGAIRLKPEAYGSDINSVIKQLQVFDVTRGHLADMQVIDGFGQMASGVNEQIMGLLANQGGRKTAQEVRTSATFGVSRLKTSSEFMSAMGWSPLGRMLVQNTQQYMEQDRKFRLVGDLAQEAGRKFIDVDPEAIQGFFDLVPVDGTLPVDRFAQANLWRELFAQMRNFPEVTQQYDMTRIFAWVAQLAGLKNINQFKINVVPDEQAALEAQRGNLVPIKGGRDLDRVPESGQIPGLGTSG